MVRTPKAQVDATASAGGHGDSSVHHVVQHLRGGIISGEYPHDTKLLPKAIAERCGTSFIPVREALRILESEGFVVFRHNRGAWVTTLSIADLEDLYELRIELESEAVRRGTPLRRTRPGVAWRCPRQDPHRQPAPAGREGRCAEPRLPLPHLSSYQLATAAEDDRATVVARRAVPAHVGGVPTRCGRRGAPAGHQLARCRRPQRGCRCHARPSDVDRQPPPNRILERRDLLRDGSRRRRKLTRTDEAPSVRPGRPRGSWRHGR